MAGEIQLEERDTSEQKDRFGHLVKVAPKVAAE